MQDPNRPQVYAVVCRQAGSSVQVLLHKVGRGPPSEKRWAFVGGLPQPSEDGGPSCLHIPSNEFLTLAKDHYYAALLRILNKTCNNDVAPNFQLMHFALTTNPSKPISYHVVTVPAGNDSWPNGRDGNDSATIGGHTYTAKQGGFVWVDFGNLLNEAKRRTQNTHPSAVHIGVLQWFSLHGDTILGRLGSDAARSTAGSGTSGAASTSGSGNRVPCKFIVSGQTCPYGLNCRFAHDTTPAASPTSPVVTPAAMPAMDATQMRALAEMFLTHYVTNFAAGSEAIMTLYQPTSVLTVDGHTATGPQQIAERLKALHAQQVKLQPNTLFVQGVPGGSVLVSTSGMMAVGAATPPQALPFAMVFHLVMHGQNWVVSNQMWWPIKQ